MRQLFQQMHRAVRTPISLDSMQGSSCRMQYMHTAAGKSTGAVPLSWAQGFVCGLQASLEGHRLAVTGAIRGLLQWSATQQSPLHATFSHVHACSPMFAASPPVQLCEADRIVPVLSSKDEDAADPLIGLGVIMQGSSDIQHVILKGDLVAFQKQANHARQVGIVKDIEWPCQPPQPCSRQDSRLKLSLVVVATAASSASSHYQIAAKPSPSKVHFSAATSKAIVLSAQEHAIAFPQEEYASPAVTCLKDRAGKVQDLIRDILGKGRSMPPSWRRLEILVQAIGEHLPVQSAICT